MVVRMLDKVPKMSETKVSSKGFEFIIAGFGLISRC
jgi:hypothetical protein